MKKLILIIFGIFLSFMILELGLRISGSIYLSFQEHRNIKSINKKGEYRILALGESTTMGQWPEILEDILTESTEDIKFSVIDKGIGGTNTDLILNNLNKYIGRYHPNMIITMMGINDNPKSIDLPLSPTDKYKNIFSFFKSFRIYKLIKLLRSDFEYKIIKMKLFFSNNTYDEQIEMSRKYKNINNYKLSKKLLKKAILLNPEKSFAYDELGRIYSHEREYAKAIELLNKAIELNPDSRDTYVDLLNSYNAIGEKKKQEEILNNMIIKDPQNDWAYLNLGEIYSAKGEYLKAVNLFKKVIAINPSNEWAYIKLAGRLREKEKYKESEDLLKTVISINPNNYRAYMLLGECYKAQEKNRMAEDIYQKFISLNPSPKILNYYKNIFEQKVLQSKLIKTDKILKYYFPMTVNNYKKLKSIAEQKNIKLVAVQYPLREIQPLKNILTPFDNIIFVDNEMIFKNAVRADGYDTYFSDGFGGDFGHCTEKGNKLLAKNIAETILDYLLIQD